MGGFCNKSGIEHAGATGAEGGQRARAAASDSKAIPLTRSFNPSFWAGFVINVETIEPACRQAGTQARLAPRATREREQQRATR